MNATTFQPTPEQIDACSQHTDSHGKSYWTVRSATDEDAWYTLRKHPGYVKWMCNCRAGREGVTSCWHRRTVEFLEAQEAQPYSPAPFSLLKQAEIRPGHEVSGEVAPGLVYRITVRKTA